jgi:hypothetical protein
VVHLIDESGAPPGPGALRQLRAEYGEEIRSWLAERCEEWNRLGERVMNLHLETPPPDAPLAFAARPFEEPRPEPFAPRELDLLERSWPPHRKKLESENAAGKQAYEEALWEWRRRRSAHETAEAQRRKALDIGRYGDRVVMESFLAERLAGLSWPTETTLAFEISLDTSVVFLDLELPGSEVVPAREAAVATRGLRLRFRELSEAQLRRAYAWHLHALLFRLLGEVFVTLPGVERVVASGYSTGADDPLTGEAADNYLLSVEVERASWQRLDFTRIETLDLIAAFERFRLRRKLTKNGVFANITPFGAPLAGGLFDRQPALAGSRPKR